MRQDRVSPSWTRAGKHGEIKPNDVAQQRLALKKAAGQSAFMPKAALKASSSLSGDAAVAAHGATEFLDQLDAVDALRAADRRLGKATAQTAIDRMK